MMSARRLYFDGIGAGNGRLIGVLTTFHQASVRVKGPRTIELVIGRHDATDNGVGLTIENGVVMYNEG